MLIVQPSIFCLARWLGSKPALIHTCWTNVTLFFLHFASCSALAANKETKHFTHKSRNFLDQFLHRFPHDNSSARCCALDSEVLLKWQFQQELQQRLQQKLQQMFQQTHTQHQLQHAKHPRLATENNTESAKPLQRLKNSAIQINLIWINSIKSYNSKFVHFQAFLLPTGLPHDNGTGLDLSRS